MNRLLKRVSYFLVFVIRENEIFTTVIRDALIFFSSRTVPGIPPPPVRPSSKTQRAKHFIICWCRIWFWPNSVNLAVRTKEVKFVSAAFQFKVIYNMFSTSSLFHQMKNNINNKTKMQPKKNKPCLFYHPSYFSLVCSLFFGYKGSFRDSWTLD